ncbi:Coq4 family protein [Synechococcus sp. CCY 9618]|uniref:Coq4 family protein n=1 Tax=Synechococcus sp. CCY 9618 TaxID=2815602 RepID=UPI001C23489E|nr:Coq4 family protein [Synechococcus sp. CCY 9618]
MATTLLPAAAPFEAQAVPPQLFRIFGTVVAMGGGDTSLELVGALSEALLETPSYALAAEHLRRDPACAALIDQRWIPPAHDLTQLAALPQGCLGQVYGSAMGQLGYDPNLHAGMEPTNDAVYVELRLSQTHDLWHVITGFDTSVIGEIGLQAFHLSQFPYPLASALTAQSLLSITVLEPELLPPLVEAIRIGLEMGREARPLFAQRWEEGWAKPLQQWREELQLRPFAEWLGRP